MDSLRENLNQTLFLSRNSLFGFVSWYDQKMDSLFCSLKKIHFLNLQNLKSFSKIIILKELFFYFVN